MIGVVDYGRGNVGSVLNACAFLGAKAELVSTPEAAEACDGLIVPGQGHFGDCVRSLTQAGFDRFIPEWIAADRPLFGICVGLQLLFEGSEESPADAGLGVLPGVLRKFVPDVDHKVPQMGWNRIRIQPAGAGLYEDVEDNAFFYFVHSYYVPLEGDVLPAWVGSTTDYRLNYVSAVCQGNLWATQFHPEKSQRHGLQLLKNFLHQTKHLSASA